MILSKVHHNKLYFYSSIKVSPVLTVNLSPFLQLGRTLPLLGVKRLIIELGIETQKLAAPVVDSYVGSYGLGREEKRLRLCLHYPG